MISKSNLVNATASDKFAIGAFTKSPTPATRYLIKPLESKAIVVVIPSRAPIKSPKKNRVLVKATKSKKSLLL